MTAPSKEWTDQFRVGSGGPVLSCSCGRTHVAIDSDDLDSEEAAKYEAKAIEYPKAYVIHHDVDSVSETPFAGRINVDGCECNSMARLEEFVWRERDIILGYYRARSEKAKNEAAGLDAALPGASP